MAEGLFAVGEQQLLGALWRCVRGAVVGCAAGVGQQQCAAELPGRSRRRRAAAGAPAALSSTAPFSDALRGHAWLLQRAAPYFPLRVRHVLDEEVPARDLAGGRALRRHHCLPPA
ncbi:hypothetical protein LUTEI9C_40120 [Luteimonas sp. 9C]|nr:hypothetical protein LUTEI9C_40120 [Luteimonas sp. 9C]